MGHLACGRHRCRRPNGVARHGQEDIVERGRAHVEPFDERTLRVDMIEEAKGEKPFSGGRYLSPRQVLRELADEVDNRARLDDDGERGGGE